MLALALASSAMPPSAIVPAPGADAFSSSVDAEAGRACHARNGWISGDAAFVWAQAFMLRMPQPAARHVQRIVRPAAPTDPREIRSIGTTGSISCAVGGPAVVAMLLSSVRPMAKAFGYDIHVHKTGECWLKHEPNISVPVAAGPTLPRTMLDAPRRDWPWAVSTKVWPKEKPPEKITWQSGIVAPRVAPTWQALKVPGWQLSFCKKHGC